MMPVQTRSMTKKLAEKKEEKVEEKVEETSYALTYEEFCSHGFSHRSRVAPYTKALYEFYKENYVGHENTFSRLIESWNGIRTIQAFGNEYFSYLREQYNICTSGMWDQFEIFLGLGQSRYNSRLRIRYCRENGTEKFNKYWTYELGRLTSTDYTLIKNKSAPLPAPSGEFKSFTGWYEGCNDEWD